MSVELKQGPENLRCNDEVGPVSGSPSSSSQWLRFAKLVMFSRIIKDSARNMLSHRITVKYFSTPLVRA